MQCVSWTSNSLIHLEAKDEEETLEPEDHHTSAFGAFDNFYDEPSLQNIKYFLDSLCYDRKNDVYNLKISWL